MDIKFCLGGDSCAPVNFQRVPLEQFMAEGSGGDSRMGAKSGRSFSTNGFG